MKKSQFIIIPILLIQLLLPIVYAEVNYELVFSGEVPNNEEFTADGKTFHVVTIDSTRAKVKFPNSLSAILYVGECKFEANYNYCLTSIRQGEFDIPSQDYPLYPNVKIEKPHVVVSMSRTFGKTSILKGETTKVEVSISNSGSYSVMDAQFIDEYPSDIRISGVVDCEVSGNKVLWDGNIGLNNPVEFSYYIKGLKDTEFSSKAYLIFEEDNISESQTITVKESQLRVNTTITPEEVDLSKEVFIQIYLENLNGEYALQDMEYRIYLPDNVIQLNKKDDALERRGSYYRFNTDFEAKSKTNMTINMTMLEEGTYKVKEKIVYTINELKEEVNYEKTINVIQKKIRDES